MIIYEWFNLANSIDNRKQQSKILVGKNNCNKKNCFAVLKGGQVRKAIYSIDGYTEKIIDFEKIDLIGTDDIKALLKDISDGTVFIAQKNVGVYATKASVGQVLDLRMRFSQNGRVYALKKQKYVVQEKDVSSESMMISYPDGQTFLVKGDTFKNNYSLDSLEWDLYKPNDIAKKYTTLTKNIYFKTPWGEYVYAPLGSKLCIEYASTRDFFIVSNSLFKVAYNIIGTQEDIDEQNMF